MGSAFSLDPFSILNLFHLNPSDASETCHRFCFPTGGHPVDPTAEYVDAIASSESGQQQQQQQQPATRGQPSLFSKVKAAGVFQ